jgi:hypothetical protein
MFVGTFAPADFYQFQTDVQSIVTYFQKAGVQKLLIDVTNNGGMIVLVNYVHQVDSAVIVRWLYMSRIIFVPIFGWFANWVSVC